MHPVLLNIQTFNYKCESLPKITTSYTSQLDALVERLDAILGKGKDGVTIFAIMEALKNTRPYAVKFDWLTTAPLCGIAFGGDYREYKLEFKRLELPKIFKEVDAFLREHE